jgi:glycosyltransferase involved in cell wall biosynthesis
MEPIAKGLAARGHEIHLVAPWHPAITRGKVEDGVHFHFFRYAPIPSWNIFGYAEGLHADTHLRPTAWAVAPLAMAAGWVKAWRVAMKKRATIMHGHWVIPGGVIAAAAAGRLPLVVSLHGSDVFIAERHALMRTAARSVFRRAARITAPSDDLCRRAERLGADRARLQTVPYGVDSDRFAPNADVRRRVRQELALGEGPVVFTAGRLVRKKGFEYLIDAARILALAHPAVRILIAGDGDLRDELTHRAASVAPAHVTLLGNRSQSDIARLVAAADVVAVPSVRDEAGNVDGLPNFALEALASATPVVATRAGGLPQAIEDGTNGLLVPERDGAALAAAIGALLSQPEWARTLGDSARARVIREFGWARVAEHFEAAYNVRP